MKNILSNVRQKRAYNKWLFSIVAPKYKQATYLLSVGQDAFWKRKLVELLPEYTNANCLDIACGTGDLTFLLAQKYPLGTITGLDITPRMIDLAKRKNKYSNINFVIGDMHSLPFADSVFDIVTGGYALRNAPSLERALKEVHRVLKPGGTALFLDFSKSERKVVQKIAYNVLKYWGNMWGILLHGNPAIYGYIAESLQLYPDRKKLRTIFRKLGFEISHTRYFLCGVIELTCLKSLKI